MDLVTCRTSHRLVGVVVFRRIFGGKALNAVSGFGAAVHEQRHDESIRRALRKWIDLDQSICKRAQRKIKRAADMEKGQQLEHDRKKPALGLDPRVETGVPKSMPLGLTGGSCSTKKLERQSRRAMLALIPCGPCDRLADPTARPSSVTSRAQACHWFLWRGDDIPARFSVMFGCRHRQATRVETGQCIRQAKRPGESPGPIFYAQQTREAYFCCSAGLSAGFCGLVLVLLLRGSRRVGLLIV